MNYLSIDGGGTKVNMLLFDDTPKPIAFVRGTGINRTIVSKEDIIRNVRECFRKLFDGKPFEIETLYTSGESSAYIENLPENVTVRQHIHCGEAYGGLLAGAVLEEGFIALSGTGSDTFEVRDGRHVIITGGYGAVIGDDGSGVWMGVQALRAATHHADGWGEPTILTEMIGEKYGLGDSFRKIIDVIYDAESPFREAGQLVPLVGQAADRGDKVACDIFREAGRLMAEQMYATLKKAGNPARPAVVLLGGAWKSHSLFRNTFGELLRRRVSDVRIIQPAFEPVMQGVVHLMLKRGEDNIIEKLRPAFREYEWTPRKEEA